MSDNSTVLIPNEIKVQMQMQAYLDRAIGYYIFARKAVMLGVVPVGGSLFHIAVEMVLHCGLSTKHSQSKLELSFKNHELPYMWLEFKAIFKDTKLLKFDKFINHHRQWKELRYPKRKSGGSTIFFGRTKPEPKVMKRNIANLPKHDIRLEINLEDMDEFMTAIIQTIGIKPDYIKLHLQRNVELVKLYLDENTCPLFSSNKKVSSTTFLQNQKAK